jgi:AcrR family transcriptional regulator
MTRDDILEAAFQAWGRDAYRTMSLSDVATRLGVTKPAIYRHFKSKAELQDSMTADFFDHFVVRLRTMLAEAAKQVPETERLRNLVEGLAEYYARHREHFVFTFARLLGMPQPERIVLREFAARGVTLPIDISEKDMCDVRHARLHFAISTCFISVAFFHFDRGDVDTPPTEGEIAGAVHAAGELVSHGLGFAPSGLASIDYPALEKTARLDAAETAPGDGLLPAIAAAVAEAGPWDASMELVARRSGLSKSGLYAHFKSREDMLRRLFLTEFERISAVMADRASRSDIPMERLYLATTAAADYLLARQDVLVALDWVRVQRLDLASAMPATFVDLFGFLTKAAAVGECRLPTGKIDSTVHWILFLIVNMLMRTKMCDRPIAPVEHRLRALHACLCVGIEGW